MELLERMAFWKMWDERNSAHDPFIAKCIDGRVITESMFRLEKSKEKEKEAISKGFMPDGYYSAAEQMEKHEKRKSAESLLSGSSAA